MKVRWYQHWYSYMTLLFTRYPVFPVYLVFSVHLLAATFDTISIGINAMYTFNILAYQWSLKQRWKMYFMEQAGQLHNIKSEADTVLNSVTVAYSSLHWVPYRMPPSEPENDESHVLQLPLSPYHPLLSLKLFQTSFCFFWKSVKSIHILCISS